MMTGGDLTEYGRGWGYTGGRVVYMKGGIRNKLRGGR